MDAASVGAPPASEPVLVARGLRVRRGGRTILHGVDLEVSRGEVVGVLGPSGAGKSTLFRALVGESPPDEGTILLCGRDVTRDPLWRRARAGVGYLPQGPSVLWDLTVAENLAVFGSVAGGASRHLGRAGGAPPTEGVVGAAAARLDLAERLHVRAGDLSGGERRRLELARAITRPPVVLVCDEPFAGVDPAGSARLGELLRELAAGGSAVLLADHHVAEALPLCTRALLLLDGQLALSSDIAGFLEHPLVRTRYLSAAPPAR